MKTIEELKRETDVPVLMTNEQGLIIYVNDCFRQVFGWKGDEIIGQTLEAVIPSSYHDSHHLGFSRFIMTGMPTVLNHPLQLKAVTKDGREIYSEHYIIAEQHEGQWVLGATLCPIEEL